MAKDPTGLDADRPPSILGSRGGFSNPLGQSAAPGLPPGDHLGPDRSDLRASVHRSLCTVRAPRGRSRHLCGCGGPGGRRRCRALHRGERWPCWALGWVLGRRLDPAGLAPHLLSFQHAALVAAAIAALIGLHPAFPARCDRQVPSRVMVGVATGALCGAVLAVAEPLHPEPFSTFAVVAFLVSVNGVLYVATLGPAAGPDPADADCLSALQLGSSPGRGLPGRACRGQCLDDGRTLSGGWRCPDAGHQRRHLPPSAHGLAGWDLRRVRGGCPPRGLRISLGSTRVDGPMATLGDPGRRVGIRPWAVLGYLNIPSGSLPSPRRGRSWSGVRDGGPRRCLLTGPPRAPCPAPSPAVAGSTASSAIPT
jgi:hypothetical protein